jgi:hypothetical protein
MKDEGLGMPATSFVRVKHPGFSARLTTIGNEIGESETNINVSPELVQFVPE